MSKLEKWRNAKIEKITSNGARICVEGVPVNEIHCFMASWYWTSLEGRICTVYEVHAHTRKRREGRDYAASQLVSSVLYHKKVVDGKAHYDKSTALLLQVYNRYLCQLDYEAKQCATE